MSLLAYRPDWEDARARLTAWWNGADLGRACLLMTTPRPEPWEAYPPLPEPPGWVTDYSTRDLEYHVHVRLRAAAGVEYLGEACPYVNAGDLAPNCLALYLGCHGVEQPGTVWCEPCLADPEAARFDYDPANFYWRFTQAAIRRTLELAGGKLLVQFPDLIEGLDTLAALRGTQQLLLDLVERPAWVHACLGRITDRYFSYYDRLYHLIRDEGGGSHYWAWAPGRLAKLQCDCSAMISPGMFRDFMLPVLGEMTERVSYSLYHWDGPGAIPHLDALLSLPRLDVIQWTSGAGAPGATDPGWWPLYHRILDAGKGLFLYGGSREELLALKREFGPQTQRMLLVTGAPSAREGEEYLRMMEL